MPRLLLLSAILGLVLQSATAWGVRKTSNHDSRWERRFLAPREGPIRLHIALKQADNGAVVENRLRMISHPSSYSFRKWLDPTRISSLSTPVQHSVHHVEYWLKQAGMLDDATLFGGIFEVDTTVRRAERLLNTTYFVYSDGTQDIIRTDLFHIPDHVVDKIDFVTPTTEFPMARKQAALLESVGDTISARQMERRAEASNAASCGENDYVSPTCVRSAYDINYTPQPDRTTFAVYGTEGASFSPSDLTTYLSRYNKPAYQADANYTVSGNGAPDESSGVGSTFETALDTQTLLGLAWPAKGTLYKRGGVFGPNAGQNYDAFVQFLQELITNTTVPSVVSFSESMPEDQVDPAYAKRLCNMMAQVGARGVTLLFSSGDNGPQGDQPSGTHNAIFEPEFPASCPWVTSVGGTTNLANETAATKSTISLVGKLSYTASGGGFSNLFPAPAYQQPAVDGYVHAQIPGAYYSVPGFNPRGRGIPDVSAFSTNLPTVVDALTFPVGGTSASTPLWAAIVALLNDHEASHARPPLGFINPWLYALSAGELKDITTGGNNAGACNLLAGCHLGRTLGYNVSRGWDPVTGLGSPVFSRLASALDRLAAEKEVKKSFL